MTIFVEFSRQWSVGGDLGGLGHTVTFVAMRTGAIAKWCRATSLRERCILVFNHQYRVRAIDVVPARKLAPYFQGEGLYVQRLHHRGTVSMDVAARNVLSKSIQLQGRRLGDY